MMKTTRSAKQKKTLGTALAVIAALICAFILCGCQSEYIRPRSSVVPEIPDATAGPTPEALPTGGVLSAAILGNSDSINPLFTFNEDILNICRFFYEPLIGLGASMIPEPVLADDWRSDDGVNWTIKLREGVVFHDGTPLTADDVTGTVEAIKSGNGAYSDCVKNIDKIEADGLNVNIKLKGPDGLLPWKLFFPILKNGKANDPFPAGTGPFSVAGAGFSGAGSIQFERFGQYHGGRTNIDAFELKFFSDASKAAVSGCDIVILNDDAAIKYGSQLGYDVRRFDDNSLICIVPYMYTGAKITYEVNEKLKIEQLPTKRIESLSLNMRKALSEIVDRERVIERTVSGWGKEYDLPGFDNCVFRKNAEFHTPSVAAAEKLIEAEGYKHEGGNKNWFKADDTDQKEPLTINFIVNSDDVELIHACDSVVSKLKSIGVKTTVKVAAGTEFTSLFLSGEYDYTFMRLSMSFAPDMADAFANDSIFHYNGYDTSWIAGKLSGLTGRWHWSGSGTESCVAFAEELSAGLETVYARLKEEIPFIGLYVRSSCLLFSERLNWSDSAGVESWNLFPDIVNWYLV